MPKVFNIYFISVAALFITSKALAEYMPQTVLEFKSLEKIAIVKYIHAEQFETSNAKASFLSNIAIKNRKDCQGILLSSSEKGEIVALGLCENKEYIICAGGLDYCSPEQYKTQKKDNAVELYSNFNKSNFRLEFHADALIYKIQKKSCLIPYPHGCFINGWRWEDRSIYEFR